MFFFLMKQILTIQPLLIASKSGPNIRTETISFWIILITLIFSTNQTFTGKLNGFNN